MWNVAEWPGKARKCPTVAGETKTTFAKTCQSGLGRPGRAQKVKNRWEGWERGGVVPGMRNKGGWGRVMVMSLGTTRSSPATATSVIFFCCWLKGEGDAKWRWRKLWPRWPASSPGTGGRLWRWRWLWRWSDMELRRRWRHLAAVAATRVQIPAWRHPAKYCT